MCHKRVSVLLVTLQSKENLNFRRWMVLVEIDTYYLSISLCQSSRRFCSICWCLMRLSRACLLQPTDFTTHHARHHVYFIALCFFSLDIYYYLTNWPVTTTIHCLIWRFCIWNWGWFTNKAAHAKLTKNMSIFLLCLLPCILIQNTGITWNVNVTVTVN